MYFCCISSLLHHITAQFIATSALEWIAFLFGIAQVFLAYKNKNYNFYAGIVSVICYIFLYYQYKLYAESILNIYYLLSSIVGLFLWNNTQSTIQKASVKEWWIAVLILLFSFLGLVFILKTYTDSNVPVLDALVSAFAWSGTWLLLKRKIENWILLNISNLIAIPLLVYKELELTSLLTMVYFIIALLGYQKWRKEMRKSEIEKYKTRFFIKND